MMQDEKEREFSEMNLTSDSDSDPMVTDWNKELIYAICQGEGKTEKDPEEYRLQRIKTCLDEGADVDATHGKNCDTILHTAVKRDYQKIVELLIRRGAKADVPNRKGHTAITLAEILGHYVIAGIFKKQENRQLEHPTNRSSVANQFQAVDSQQPSTSREHPVLRMNDLSIEDNDDQGCDSNQAVLKSKRKSTSECENFEDAKKKRLESHNAILSESRSESPDEVDIADTTLDQRPHSDVDQGGIIQNQISRFGRELTYAAGGLKSSFHGVVYQLKHLGFTLLRAMRPEHELTFLLSSERVDVGKFDDLVLEFLDNVLFLQLKHSRNELRQVNAHDLLEKEDGDFFIPKYFSSWMAIKKNPRFGDEVAKKVVLGTNISLNLEGLKNAEISYEKLDSPVECLEMIGSKEETTCYKFTTNPQSNRKLYEKLKETSEVYALARELAEHVIQRKKITLVGMFKQYHVALGEQVIDVRNKTFFKNFINNQNLTPTARIFRKIFFSELSKQKKKFLKREVSEDVIWKEVEDSSLELSKNFGEKFELPAVPQLTDVPLFSHEFIKLIMNATPDKVVKISKSIYRKNAKKGSIERVVADNIDMLAGHVLITRSGKIKFRTQFFNDNIQSMGNVEEFKDILKSQLGSRFDKLFEFEFEINNFETCEEEQLNAKAELPDGKMAEADITEFLNSFILAINLPDEVELGEMIIQEIGNDSKFNLLDPDFIGRTFLTKIVDWFKDKGEKVGEGKYLSYKGGEIFFREMENHINTLKSMGVTSVYWEELKEYGIDFEYENVRLNILLSENDSNFVSHRILILIAPREPFLTTLRVCKTLLQVKKYVKNDSFIFIRLRTLSVQGIRDQVLRAFQSQRSHHLLVIECDSVSMKQNPHRIWLSLCKALRTVQDTKKTIILIARGDERFAASLAQKFKNVCKIHIQEDDDISFDSLTKVSRRKLLEKQILNFQGHGSRFSFEELLAIEDLDNIGVNRSRDISELIDSSTLGELIRGDDEIRIGSEVEGLGEITDYYIKRRILRHVVIKADIFKDEQIPDLLAISCGDGELQGKASEKTETSSSVRNLRNITVLDSNGKVEQFETLCQNNRNRNVHWLEEQSGKYIWKQSVGSINYLLKFKDASANDYINGRTDGPHSNEEQFAAHNEPVIVSDTAGMGKSTIMTHLAEIIKKAEPGLLVLKIDLNRHTTALADVKKNSNYNLGVIDGGVDFLVNELLNLRTNLERKVFKTIIKHQRNVALIFDGFDEISPTYENTVIELIDTLAKHKIKKLFVTTRPHTRGSLESKLNTFSYEIEPFSVANQEEFLVKFWNNGLGLDDSDQRTQGRIRNYAQALIMKLSDSINDRMNKFTGIPLQTKLVADIFRNLSEGRLGDFDSCEKFKDSSDDKPKFPNKIDLIYLYELFVDMKFDNFFKKRGGNLEDPGVIEGRRLQYDAFIDAHEKVALSMLLEEDEVKELLPYEKGKKREGNVIQERTGIITQFINGKPHFGHRTYAEYFAAKFLFNKLEEGIQNPRVKKIFVADIFLGQSYETLRAFMNCLLSDQRSKSFEDDSWSSYFKEYSPFGSRTVFHVAAMEANNQIMKLFLKWFTNDPSGLSYLINLKDEDGRTAVYWAADQGHLEELRILVDLGGGQVDTHTGKDRGTALHTAASYGRLNIVTYLLTKNATVDSIMFSNTTPLHLAAENGKLDVVIHLLNNGAGINNQNDYGETPLFNATYAGRFDVVKYLLEKGAEVNCTDKRGRTPLHVATNNSRLDMMECLLTKEAIVDLPNHDGEIALYMAASRGQLDSVRYLIDKGADVNFQCKFGATPLHVAAMKGKFDVVNYLLIKGAVIDTTANDLTMMLAEPGSCSECDTLEYWCNRESFALPLNLASCTSQIDVVKKWIEKADEDVNCQSMDDGITPLHVAACLGRLDLIEYLWTNGANIDSLTHDKSTPLYAAACTGKLDVVKFLLKNGAVVDSQNKYGDTPLHIAAANGKLDVVEYLLGTKADINCQNNVGETALDKAAANDKSYVFNYLFHYGNKHSCEN